MSSPRPSNVLGQGSGGDLIQIKVYDVIGREVGTLVNEVLLPGTYIINWKASEYSSGVYFCRIETNDYVDVKRMLLLR
ncbi:MAG: T9SS type A sorting domain-containing protein [Candidatus Kapaibacterium sp.]